MTEWRSLSEALAMLSRDHPNLGMAKIRFLEAERKIVCIRDSEGNRRYSPTEVTAAMPSKDW